MPEAVRVRFAPSPTGLLHVGSVHTALFNWLYARHHGGVFVLRIEDTDEAREHPEAIEQIQRSLRWAGIAWDEGPGVGGPHGPYIQSERRPRHEAAAAELLASGAAYECWCSAAELDAERTRARAADRPYVYSRRCRSLTDADRAKFEQEGRQPALRLLMPDDGETVLDDLVRGEIRFPNATLGDHIIVRSGGVPTYNFVNPIDDSDQAVTHVIRGEDLMPSTPRQIALLRALGRPLPRYGHLALLLGPDRKRMSKRHGATSVEEFRRAGIVSEALFNYLALLGWRFDDSRELFTREELIGLFSLERVNPAPAVFDHTKLDWMNGVYLRAMNAQTYGDRLLEYLNDLGSPLAAQPAVVHAAAPLVQEKLARLDEFAGYCSFLFGPVEIDPDAWERVAANDRAATVLDAAAEALATLPEWKVEAIEGALRELCEQLELKPRAAFPPIRVALTGRTVSPGLFESAELLGRDESLARLASARARLATVS